MICELIVYGPAIVFYIAELDDANKTRLIYTTLYLLCYVLVWLISRRFKSSLVYILPLMYICKNACWLFYFDFFVGETSTGKELDG